MSERGKWGSGGKNAQTSTNENKRKSNERDQAAGTNTKHKQPQASTSEQTAEREQTRWNEREQGQEWGERRRAWGRASEGNGAAAVKMCERAAQIAGAAGTGVVVGTAVA